ncbi:unnamed protein product [Soboliphyme baturini]|uniref:KH_dom_type_1 domain-containing protein n=1 Tax=Soboliphyme baturini TaxID=241478 RepID=A0A183IU57_9BILA|nr:unnamed protein product [Soboliphyme baturini]
MGPRGSTVKRIERATNCKIIVSACSRHKLRWRRDKGQFYLESHPCVLIKADGREKDAETKIRCAEEKIRKLLNPPLHHYDKFKAKQLRELAMFRGTYTSRRSRRTLLGSAVSTNLDYAPLSGMARMVGNQQIKAESFQKQIF